MAKPKIWERTNPKKKTTRRSPQKQQARAKRAAKAHGRSTPSLVDNINAQQSTTPTKKKKKKEKKRGAKK